MTASGTAKTGYGHHYDVVPEIDVEMFGFIADDFGRLLEPLRDLGVRLGGWAGYGEPTVSKDMIQFNGLDSDGGSGEPFTLERHLLAIRLFSSKINGRYRQVTHTERKPYDLAVMACLVVAKHHMGSSIIVSSEGGRTEWQKAIVLCEKVLGYGTDFTFHERRGIYDHMDDVETLQEMAKRLETTQGSEAAIAHLHTAIQVVWDLDDTEGAADRISEQGYMTTAQCHTCGKLMYGEVTCETCLGSGSCRWHQTEGKA